MLRKKFKIERKLRTSRLEYPKFVVDIFYYIKPN